MVARKKSFRTLPVEAAVGTGNPPVRVMPKVLPKTPIDPLPGTWDKRVFVGGDYDHLAVLKAIQKAVIKSGFQPISKSRRYRELGNLTL